MAGQSVMDPSLAAMQGDDEDRIVENALLSRKQKMAGISAHETRHPNPLIARQFIMPPDVMDPEKIQLQGDNDGQKRKDVLIHDVAGLWHMKHQLHNQKLIAFQVKKMHSKQFKGNLSLLMLSTLECEFVIDVMSLGPLLALFLRQKLQQTLLLGFNCHEEILDLMEQLEIHPIAVTDVGNILKTAEKKATPTMFGPAMLEVLGEGCLMYRHKRESQCQHVDWSHRSLTDEQVKYAASDSFYLLMAWKNVYQMYDPDLLQSAGCDAMKPWVLATVWVPDPDVTFPLELKNFIKLQQQGYLFPKDKENVVWALWHQRKIFANIIDPSITIALSFADLVKLAIKAPQTEDAMRKWLQDHPAYAVKNLASQQSRILFKLCHCGQN